MFISQVLKPAVASVLGAMLLAACATHESAVGSSPEAAAQARTGPSERRAAELALMQRPNAYFEERLQEPPVTIDGQTLHPKLQYEFEQRRAQRTASGVDYNQWLMRIWSTDDGRRRLRDEVDLNWTFMAEQIAPLAREEVRHIPDGAGGEMRVRIYSTTQASQGPKPVLIYFHGGAFIMASAEAVEPQMRILATRGDVVVVNVNYRLAPEAPFPAAFEDGLAAYRWVLDHMDEIAGGAAPVGVGGDSAGGNISLVISDEARRRGWPMPAAQLLYYPVVDMNFDRYPSYELFGEGYGLDRDFIRLATDQVVTDSAMLSHRWLNPLDQADLAAMPPSIVVAAGFDPIRDHATVLADRINEAGGQAELVRASSLNHGFLEVSGVIDDAQEICRDTAEAIGVLLRR